MLGRSGRRGRPAHPDVLTPAEWRVLEHLRDGRTNAEIAVRLGISPDGVKFHVSNMLAKLNLRDRTALAAWDGVEGQSGPESRSRLWGAFAKLPGATPVKLAAVVVGVAAVGGVAAIAIVHDPRFDGDIPDVRATLTVKTAEMDMTGYLDGASHAPGATNEPPPDVTSSHTWFSAAAGFRIESTAAGADRRSVLLANRSGVYGWSVTPPSSAKDVLVLQDSPATFMAKVGTRFQPLPTLKGLVAAIAPDGSARVTGNDTIAGRAAYRIDVDSGPCPRPLPLADGPTTLWIDKETFVLLKIVAHSSDDGRIVLSQEVTHIVYNQPIDNAVFQLPQGAIADTPAPEPAVPAAATPVPTAGACPTPRAATVDPGFATAQSGIAIDHGSVQPPPRATIVVNATGVAVATVQSP